MAISNAVVDKNFKFIELIDEIPYPEHLHEEVFRVACTYAKPDAINYLADTRKEKLLAFIKKNIRERWIQRSLAPIAEILHLREDELNT